MTAPYIIKFTPTAGATGTLIEYRQAGSSVWITPTSTPNPTTGSQYPLDLEKGKSYYVSVSAISPNCRRRKAIITVVVPAGPDLPCCPSGFTLSPDNTFCYKEETMPPEILSSGMCLAYSKESGAYSGDGARLYDPGFSIHLPSSNTYTALTGAYWTGTPAGYGDPNNSGSSANESVMNRDSVWIDADCDGTKDALAACSVLQFTYLLNLSSPKRVYVGLGGDNTFRLDINNNIIVQCEAGPSGIVASGGTVCATAPAASSSNVSNSNFNLWHIIPVDLPSGPNYLNFQATGDGSVNDAFAAIVYDNTAQQIAAATSDAALNILFRTGDFKGERLDIAVCEAGWQLDTSAGIGNYVCRKITQSPTISC
ncbi:hypothetical protein SAMN05428988_3221 [Chitinophaga sp. YR573]|uniref:hypothetical protein n=1 Tax=Chitinophaga sp. YR573 TaxID=1881040 RepID=UPI0008C834DA|nr:hypothetical protein [Chitinophaga sp. YR573]SEW21532.1 hypothetical protein SAMN05428988_3221 [Chitinophaga sp. YR573]